MVNLNKDIKINNLKMIDLYIIQKKIAIKIYHLKKRNIIKMINTIKIIQIIKMNMKASQNIKENPIK